MKQDPYQRAKERWQDCEDAFREQRSRMVDDLKFSNPADLQQWDDKIRNARERAPNGARPCMTFDQTNQYIQNVVNDFRQNKPQINAVPANSGDEKVAEALSGIIRQIEAESRASIAYDTAVEYAARVGRGWVRIVPEVVDDQYNLQTLRIKRIHDPLTIKPDPSYTEPDGMDQTHGFVETLMPKAQFQAKYKGKRAESWEGKSSDWFQDDQVRVCEYFEQIEEKESRLVIVVPNDPNDPSPREQTTTVSEDEYWEIAKKIGFKPAVKMQYWAKKKRVEWSMMNGDDFVDDTTDFPSKYIPLVPFHGTELWIEGKRYLSGMVRPMMDAQRAVNYSASSDIEMVTQQPKAPYLAAWEAIEEFEGHWKGLNTSNAAYLPYNAFSPDGQALPAPSRQAPPQGGAAYGRMTEQAIGFVKSSIGNYGSNLGAPSNAISGRAKLADERQGDTANYHYQDNAARSIEQVGRILVDAFPVIYADTKYGPRDMRTLGLDGAMGAVTIDPEMPQAFQQQGKKVVAINPTTGTYDVRIKVGPAFASLRAETAESLTKIVQSSPQLMSVLGPMWARMQDWPEAEKVSKLLLALAPPQVQAIEGGEEEIPPQAMAQIQQLTQHVEQLTQALQQEHGTRLQLEQDVKSKAGVEQMRAQSQLQREGVAHQKDVALEHIRGQTQMAIEQIKHDNDVQLQQMKDQTAHLIAEVNGMVTLLAKQIAPPQQVIAEASKEAP